jgi:hypothetical protein
MKKYINEDLGIEGDWDMTDTNVYLYKFYNHIRGICASDIAESQDFKTMRETKEQIQQLDKCKDFICSRFHNKDCEDEDNIYCNFTAETKEELMAHERTCFHIKEREVESKFKNLECDICGKKFYDKGQKFKPIYALNAHKKTCSKTLKKRTCIFIKENLDKLPIGDLLKIKSLIE